MIRPPAPEIDVLLYDDGAIDQAIAEAQRDAARRHALLGEAVVIWREGRMVIEVPSAEDAPDADSRPV